MTYLTDKVDNFDFVLLFMFAVRSRLLFLVDERDVSQLGTPSFTD
jgi:hypothetical protein